MKIGFSSLVCPGWDLARIVDQAANLGFQGVELRGLRGEFHLPLVPELAADPDGTRRLFEEKNVELLCLGASATLDSRKPREVAEQKAVLEEFIALADRLGCRYVRIFPGEVQRWDNRRLAIGRIANALVSMIPVVSRYNVTLLVENGGDFPGSDDLWFLIDAVGHPSIACCWNQCNGRMVGERPTNSLPRLGRSIGFVHVCDATFDEQGVLLEYRPLGEGDLEVVRQIDILRGLTYNRYLVFEWPKMWVNSLPEPEAVLPGVATFLKERIDARQDVLSAYKGDKKAPKLAALPTNAR